MIHSVLCAVDGSRASWATIEAAAELALPRAATFILMRAVILPFAFPPAAANAPKDPLPEILEAEALRDLQRLVAEHPRIAGAGLCVRSGSQPWRTILEVADELDVDLVVVGSHGYRVVDRVFETTAARVANRSRHDVLVVHGTREKGCHAHEAYR